jgi:hypothetical protein
MLLVASSLGGVIEVMNIQMYGPSTPMSHAAMRK